ncbi:MAG: hypothetical protein ACLRIS_08035 [Flavonifractor plautii]
MRGYYYDQTGEAPRSTPAPIFAGRRRQWSGAAVLLFLLTMALLGGLTAAAGLWSYSRLEELPALAGSSGSLSRPGGVPENHGRAGPHRGRHHPHHLPCPAAGPTASRRFTGEHRLHRQHPGEQGGRHEPGHRRGDVGGRVYHHQQPRH